MFVAGFVTCAVLLIKLERKCVDSCVRSELRKSLIAAITPISASAFSSLSLSFFFLLFFWGSAENVLSLR